MLSQINIGKIITESSLNHFSPFLMQITKNSPKSMEKIFLICDQCMWTVTCLNKKYLEELSEISDTEYSCPTCKQDELSSFPITSNDSFRYEYSKKKGLDISFGTNE